MLSTGKLLLFIVSFFNIGLISKKMPGTLGSIAATGIAILLPKSAVLSLCISLGLFIIGVVCSNAYIAKYQRKSDKDPGYIVIDEACGIFFGYAILLFANLFTTLDIIINFLLFRLFDILKPFPIKNIEKHCKSHSKLIGFGIMIDDVLAIIIATILQITVTCLSRMVL
ncbi:MAG: phosphatidylglycerophosphatase A [Holosporales bacterium]|nr:phosphatidylglycerophosphatase A [Holosporales bacterium]